jgi:predicted nuclease with TOPRIM domain
MEVLMMKKTWIALAVLIILLLSVSIPVLAVETTAPSKRAAASELAARAAGHQEILDLRNQVLENRQAILDQVSVNQNLRLTLQEQLKANRAGLSAETLRILKDLRQQIKRIQEDLRSSEGEIRDLNTRLRSLNPRADLAAMKAVYQKILRVQALRLEKLEAIGKLLEQMLAIVEE